MKVSYCRVDDLRARPGHFKSSGAKPWIAFFGLDINDVAVQRRIQTFEADGVKVDAFMMRRVCKQEGGQKYFELGVTRDGELMKRGLSLLSAAFRVHRSRRIERAKILYARNLDMLVCAYLVKVIGRHSAPIVYECLDIHVRLWSPGVTATVLRLIEAQLLKRCDGLIVSSPGFIRSYFEVKYDALPSVYLIENRLIQSKELPARRYGNSIVRSRAIRVGYIGKLRCRKSIELLLEVAERFGDDLEIHLYGSPVQHLADELRQEAARCRNVFLHGRFNWPDDLADVYGAVDLVWGGDFSEAGGNSDWLLPNRLYEAGYFGTPVIAPAGTELARWLTESGAGFVIDKPYSDSFAALLSQLLSDRSLIDERAFNLGAMEDSVFVQPGGLMAALYAALIEKAAN